jgi:hypothetical protein
VRNVHLRKAKEGLEGRLTASGDPVLGAKFPGRSRHSLSELQSLPNGDQERHAGWTEKARVRPSG